MYKVILAPEFKGWLEDMSTAEQNDVLAALSVLRQYGH